MKAGVTMLYSILVMVDRLSKFCYIIPLTHPFMLSKWVNSL